MPTSDRSDDRPSPPPRDILTLRVIPMQFTNDIVPAALRPYAGMRPPIADPIQRAEHMAFNLTTECLAPLESPFMRIARNGLMLCPATEAYLYDPAHRFGFID